MYAGWEIAGIKFHAPIDVIIRKNRIHECGRGIWLDWMTQGARVSANLLYNNDQEDLFVEVNHGPFMVDNNILLSAKAINNQSQGGAYVHNLIAGKISVRNEPNRFTPYFLPHSIEIAGLTTIYGGDDRFFNNLIVGNGDKDGNIGLVDYDNVRLPVWLRNNVFYNQAIKSEKDMNALADNAYNPNIRLKDDGRSVELSINLDRLFFDHEVTLVTTEILGKAKVSKAAFENPDGKPLTIDSDYFGNKVAEQRFVAGPFARVSAGSNTLKIWEN